MSDINKILDKLAKLKAMRDGAAKIGSMDEADAFAQTIQRMLLEHELSEIDVEMHSATAEDPIVEVPFDHFAYGVAFKRTRVAWEQALADFVAKAHLSTIYVNPGSNRITFVGTKPNAMMAEYCYGVLAKAAHDMSIKARLTWCNEQRKNGTYGEGTNDYRAAWLNAFVHRIRERFEEQRKKSVEETGNVGTAMIRLDSQLVRAKEYLKNPEKFKKTPGIRQRVGANADGRRDGRNAADKLAIDRRGVGAGTNKPTISLTGKW
jgi:hypothetical protein